jgi:hypothetical protein
LRLDFSNDTIIPERHLRSDIVTRTIKLLAASLCLAAALPLAAEAASVGASGSAQIFWNLQDAVDKDGNFVDGSGAYTETGTNSLFVSAGVSQYNTVSSSGTRSATYTITNTSTDIFLNWFSQIDIQSNSGGFVEDNVLGEFYYDANAFIQGGSVSAFSSVNDTYICSIINGNDPNYNCFGSSQGGNDGQSGSEFGTLAPGESISFFLEGSAFATLRQTPVSPVPIPGAAVLLASGLAGLGFLRRHKKAALSQ